MANPEELEARAEADRAEFLAGPPDQLCPECGAYVMASAEDEAKWAALRRDLALVTGQRDEAVAEAGKQVEALRARVVQLSEAFMHPFEPCNPPDGTCHNCGGTYEDAIHFGEPTYAKSGPVQK